MRPSPDDIERRGAPVGVRAAIVFGAGGAVAPAPVRHERDRSAVRRSFRILAPDRGDPAQIGAVGVHHPESLPRLPARGVEHDLPPVRRPGGPPQFASDGLLLRLTNPEPAASTMPMSSSCVPPRDWAMRISRRRPSGDHCGNAAPMSRRAAMAGEETRCTGPPGEPVHSVSAAVIVPPAPGGGAQSNARTRSGSSVPGSWRSVPVWAGTGLCGLWVHPANASMRHRAVAVRGLFTHPPRRPRQGKRNWWPGLPQGQPSDTSTNPWRARFRGVSRRGDAGPAGSQVSQPAPFDRWSTGA